MLSPLCFLLFPLFFVIPAMSKKIRSIILTILRVEETKRELVSIEQRLPRELVSNILSRLPAKDLLKCKRVCKSWFDLLTDPHFITNYYVVYNSLQSQEKHLLVIRRPFLSNLKTYISVLSWKVNDPRKHVSSDVLNPPYEYNSEHKYWTEILGPCNGLYFLQGNPNVMINPSLRQFKALPESHLSDERELGYWTAELYSLNSNSWRKLDAALPLPIEIWGSPVYTYVNNCCYWWGLVDESGRKEDVVLAFDMVNESFRKIKVPRIRYSSEEEFATLAPFDESATIGIVVYPVRGKEKSFDVWVMKDYWDEGSWVKQYTSEPVEAIYKVVGFYGSNQFLWSSCNDGLVWYDNDPESEQIKDLRVYGKNGSLRAAKYMESLVSLKRGNEFSCQLVSSSLVPDPLLDQME
ncbi:F-box protein CPR30 [Spatholobus suberectus]|nr:F-box protein CPR30 [Spatholobus suberectus]